MGREGRVSLPCLSPQSFVGLSLHRGAMRWPVPLSLVNDTAHPAAQMGTKNVLW